MAEGFNECEGKCEHWYYCDWGDWCGDCNTCPAFPDYCKGNNRCHLAKENNKNN